MPLSLLDITITYVFFLCVYHHVCQRLPPPELGWDVGLDNGLLAELLYPLLLGLHLLVLLEVLNVLGVREVFELGVLVVVPGLSVPRPCPADGRDCRLTSPSDGSHTRTRRPRGAPAPCPCPAASCPRCR
jgi:hypothetical protein